MDLVALRTLIGERSLCDVEACRRELEHVRVGRGLLDAREVSVLGRLDELTVQSPSIFPDDEVAKAAKSSLLKASKVRSRKQACGDVPELGVALANGDTTGERVDIFVKAATGLTSDELDRVGEHGGLIAAAAANSSDRQYRETIERIVGRARLMTGSTGWLSNVKRHGCGAGLVPMGCGTWPANSTRSVVANSKAGCGPRSKPCFMATPLMMLRSTRWRGKIIWPRWP
jgi:hypothetical protein